jgi:hypothetical protein
MTKLPRRSRKKALASDPDIDAWVRLAGGVPDSELDGLTENERRIAIGNATAREFFMQASTAAMSRRDQALRGSIVVPRFGRDVQ